MLEKDIENLIVKYPKEFFPKSDLTLIGQQYKLGSCRADIVFQDKFDRYIIIEIKRGILSRDASGQVMEYYGRLKQEKPNAIIELVLCANTIPPERRTFLENVGIECKEASVSFITNLAKKYDYKFLDDLKENNEKENSNFKKISFNISNTINKLQTNVWIFQANPQKYDILNALAESKSGDCINWLVAQHKDKIKKGDIGLIWMSGKDSGIYAITEITTNPETKGEFSNESKYWIDDKQKNQIKLRVTLKIIKRLHNNPIFRKYLKEIPDLKNLSILKFAQATNFHVTSNEWKIISEIINKQK